jgi:hypothetical protein
MVWINERVTDDGDKRFVACYRDPEGRQRSAGTYPSRRAAVRAANREEAKVRDGTWHDSSRGEVTFAAYVETVWLPSKHVETSTLAAYRSYLDKHFLPPSGAGRWARSCPARSNAGSPPPPTLPPGRGWRAGDRTTTPSPQPHVGCRPTDPRRHPRDVGGTGHENRALTGEYRDGQRHPAHRTRGARLAPHLLDETAFIESCLRLLRVLERRLQSPTRPVS